MVSQHLPNISGATPPRILIADDDPDLRDALHLVLEDAGYEALEVEDGAAALQMLTCSATPLLVLLDLLMPQMSGEQVLMQASTDPSLMARHAYLVLTAAPLSPTHVGRELARLLSTYDIPTLAKPFDLGDLLAEVARMWRRLVLDQKERKSASQGEVGAP